jgi:hypothetical protein
LSVPFTEAGLTKETYKKTTLESTVDYDEKMWVAASKNCEFVIAAQTLMILSNT